MLRTHALTPRGRRILDKVDACRREVRNADTLRALDALADAVELLVLSTPGQPLWTKEEG